MAKKNKQLANWGSTLGAIGGILWIIIGVLMVIGVAASGILSVIDVFNTYNWIAGLGGGLTALVSGIIWIAIGAFVLLLSIGRFGLNWVAIGIILIVFAIIGSGIPAILVLIGGILFIIAGL